MRTSESKDTSEAGACGRTRATRSCMGDLLDLLDRSIAALLRGLQWLILPVVLRVFLQWPLRDLVRSHSREANDLGQWIFALYVAASVTAATRARTHLAADAVARRYGLRILAALVRWSPRPRALGAARGDRRQESGVEFAPCARGFSRHLQPRLLRHQSRLVGIGRAGARPGRARHRVAAPGGGPVTAWSGLGLLVLVGAGIVLTGLPAFVVLIAAASLGAVVGLASGVVPFSPLTALPGRLVNLLDNDLLQA